jgi:hypothetical protein
LISIFQALKQNGALVAEIELIWPVNFYTIYGVLAPDHAPMLQF